MFSSLARRISPRLIDRLDLLVELSTLGEYGVDRDGVFALDPPEKEEALGRDGARPVPPRLREAPRVRDACPRRGALSQSCRDGAARP